MITMTSVLCVLATLVAMGGLPATLPKALSKYKVSISIKVGADDRGFEFPEQTLGAGEVAVPLTQLSNLTSDLVDVIGPVRSPSLLKNRGPSTEGCKSTKIFGQSKSVPVQIVQVGVPRTGSTFQFTLLCAMARLRLGRVDCRYQSSPIKRKKLRGSVVLKTHLRGNKWLKKMHMQGNIHVFSSGDTDLYGHVNQQKKDLIECATCQVERYRCLFQLSDHEVTVVKTFITMWGTLRKCCGSQMSKYERLRLHKCDIRSYVNRTNYPHCEKLDLERLERRFLAIPLPFDRQGFYPGKVGDCRRSREEIVKGKDFNGRKFQGCRRSKEEEAKVEEGARRGL